VPRRRKISAKGRGRSDTKDYERPPLIAHAYALRARFFCDSLCVDRQLACVISSTWLWYLPNLQNRSEVPFLPPSMIIHSATAAKLLNNVIWCDSLRANANGVLLYWWCACVSVMCEPARNARAMRRERVVRARRSDDYKDKQKRVLKETNQFCATILSLKKEPFLKPSLPHYWISPPEVIKKKQPNLIFFSQPISP